MLAKIVVIAGRVKQDHVLVTADEGFQNVVEVNTGRLMHAEVILTAANKSHARDDTWKLLRFQNGNQQMIPAWAGFNSYLTKQNLPVATVRYLPFICAPPTDLSVIYICLQKLLL